MCNLFNVSKVLASVLILFLLVFQFNVPYFINSSFLAGFLSFVLSPFLCVSQARKVIGNKVFWCVQVLFFTPLLYALFFSVSIGYGDESFVSYILNTPLFIVSAYFCAITLRKLNRTFDSIVNVLLLVLLIQAAISIFSLLNPSFFGFVQSFQYSFANERAALYGGARGLTLSGPLFFSLAIMIVFAICYIAFFEHANKNRQYIYYVLIIIALIFLPVGRTVLICFFVFFFLKFDEIYKNSFYYKSLPMFFLVIVFVFIMLENATLSSIEELNVVLNRGFEFVYNFTEGKGIQTESTNVLQSMVFIPDVSTLILGDWTYTGNDGLYYMHTDSGYMRNVLLFGAPLTLCYIVSDWLLISRSCGTNIRQSKLASFGLFIILLILHIKGEVLAYTFPLHSLIYLLFFLNQINPYTER